MKTRAEIYGKEATDLLRIISIYRVVTDSQLQCFYPGKEDKTANLLQHLKRQGRVFYDGVAYYAEPRMKPDQGMTAALWVLLDFIDKISYHTVSDFPAKLMFFADDELYEVIHVPIAQEALISHLWNGRLKEQEPPRRIVVVDDKEQIEKIEIPSVSGYCTVSPEGEVSYFRKD